MATTRDIVVIGASVGGIEALREIVKGLPAGLPASIFVVVHLAPETPSILPTILERAGNLPASHPDDGEPIEPGHIYVAPPDYHMLLRREGIRLSRGPRENRYRPAIDPLFRSAARTFGPRVVGVILSGLLNDGAAGMVAVKSRGGIAIVQDDAMFPDMPRNAARYIRPDRVLPIKDIAPALLEIVGEASRPRLAAVRKPHPPEEEDEMEREIRAAEADVDEMEGEDQPGTSSGLACPDCHGVLWEIDDHGLLRYRCRVGHSYTAETLLSSQTESVEEALWAAVRALEESASLSEKLAQRASKHQHTHIIERYRSASEVKRKNASIIRDLLVGMGEAEPSSERQAG
jgi:two-component system chemotaxis response regulator CheB